MKRIDYAALNESHVIQEHNVHPHIDSFREFAETHPGSKENIVLIDQEYTAKHGKFDDAHLLSIIEQTGLKKPILIKGANPKITNNHNPFIDIDFNIPYYDIHQCTQKVGEKVKVPVMDIMTQNNSTNWDMKKWCEYFASFNHDKIRNVISLEISKTELGEEIEIPKIVKELDIINKMFNNEKFIRILEENNISQPKVQKYILMSVKNCYTDFHIDFAGTSVYYSLLSGNKQFILLPPTDLNLKKYKDWCLSEDQNKVWFPSTVKELSVSEFNKYKRKIDACYLNNGFVIDVQPGDLLLLPSMWIHAVHTLQDSIIIGGNYLNLLSLENHLKSHIIEIQTRVADQFKFPNFLKFIWLLGYFLLMEKPHGELEIQCLRQIRSFLNQQLDFVKYVKTKRDKLLASKIKTAIPKDIVGSPQEFLKKIEVLLEEYTVQNESEKPLAKRRKYEIGE